MALPLRLAAELIFGVLPRLPSLDIIRPYVTPPTTRDTTREAKMPATTEAPLGIGCIHMHGWSRGLEYESRDSTPSGVCMTTPSSGMPSMPRISSADEPHGRSRSLHLDENTSLNSLTLMGPD